MARYLYNGIELPALPEWDKEKYPHAYITHISWHLSSSIIGYYVWYCNKPVHAKSAGTSYTFASLTPVIYIRHKYDEDSGEWGDAKTNLGTLTENTKLSQIDKPVWCNTDMYKLVENDSDELEMTDIVALAASEPVPVGELAWQKHDAYKPNTKWDGNTFYRVMGGKWVKQDAVNPSVVVEDKPTGEPIAYLYNDVQLPDINGVWTDKVTYPYAMITRTITNGNCLLLVCGDMPYYTEQAHSTEGYEPTVIAPKPYKAFAHVDGSWVLNTEETDYGFSIRTGSFELIWTNVDVMNKDNGSVYFDASEPPVPVYA